MAVTQRKRSQPHARFDRKTGIVRLNVPLSVKADAINVADRTFEGLAATWTQDLGQDVIERGAFKASIAEWKASANAMPLLNSHDHYDIFAALGQAVAMKETPEGLWTKWEVLPGDDGDKVLQRLRPSPTTGRAVIGKMSIGFIPQEYSFEQPPGTESYWDRIRHVQKAALQEVSLVLFPMNPDAEIDASTVKMWLKMAHDADPKKIDPRTRLELRRLNSKIGLLLKKQKPADDDEHDLDDSEQLPPTPRSAPTKATQRKDDSGDTDDDLDDELEDTDDLEDSSDDSDADEIADAEDDSADSDDSGDAGDPAPSEAPLAEKDQPYEFAEALAQRLKKVTLKHQVSHIGTQS